MLSLGIVTRGKYGLRLLNTVKKYTDFEISTARIPEELPGFIDDPAAFMDELGLDEQVLSSDLIITYSLHPDLTPEIVRRAAGAGAKAVIIPGGWSSAGDPVLFNDIAKKYGIRILVEDICCGIGSDQDSTINEFSSMLGLPELEIKIVDDLIEHVGVIRGAPCGSTWWMAEQLKGVPVSEAPARAGLLVQQYPCRAVRGTGGGIHSSALLHKKAVEDAIKKYNDDSE